MCVDECKHNSKPKRSCLPSCQKILALKFARNIFLLLLKIKFQCGKALVLAMLNCLVEKVCLAPNALCLCCGSVSIFWSCVVYDFVPALWLCAFFFFYVHPGGDVGLLLAYTDFQKHTGCTAVVWKAAVYSVYLQCIRNVSAVYPAPYRPYESVLLFTGSCERIWSWNEPS